MSLVIRFVFIAVVAAILGFLLGVRHVEHLHHPDQPVGWNSLFCVVKDRAYDAHSTVCTRGEIV